nr:HINT domain-containing protein [Streptomyces sp. NBC_00857]
MLGLRGAQRGQSAVEYVGVVAVVAAIVGALVVTGVGPTLAEGIGTQVCRITGGSDCGGGGGNADAGDTEDADAPVPDPASDAGSTGSTGGTGGAGESQTRIDYEAALKELQDAQAAEKSDSDKAKEAAKELARILADELGITDALDCVTKGDMGACTETLINVLLSLVGGAVGKLAAKYGAPWKWKKAVELVKALKKHGGDLYDGLTGLVKNRKRVGDAEDRLADAKRKLDADTRGKPKDGDKGDGKNKPANCPVRHSFPPGTPVLLADGRRMAIDRIPVGTRVLATDPATGVTRARPVERTITTHDDKDFTRLSVLGSGGVPALLTATDTHPFWLSDQRRWADAGEILPGAELRTPSGATLTVTDVSRHTRRTATYDLTNSARVPAVGWDDIELLADAEDEVIVASYGEQLFGDGRDRLCCTRIRAYPAEGAERRCLALDFEGGHTLFLDPTWTFGIRIGNEIHEKRWVEQYGEGAGDGAAPVETTVLRGDRGGA